MDTTTKMWNESNPMFKENAGYFAIHDWVRRRKDKPELCERCGKEHPHDLANISQQYKRDVNDFEWLCRRCHMKSDGRMEKLKEQSLEAGKRPKGRRSHIMVNGIESKKCNNCGEILPITEFSTKKQGELYFTIYRCKNCVKQYNKRNYIKRIKRKGADTNGKKHY